MTQPRIAVLINTKGRPGFVADVVQRVKAQTLSPTHIFVVGAHPLDLAALDQTDSQLTCCVANRKGRQARLNEAIALAGQNYTHLVFFDDDFLPSRFWIERAMNLFAASPELTAVAGGNLVNETDSQGVSPAEARSIIKWRDNYPFEAPDLDPRFDLQVANLAVRSEAINQIRLDESLPFGSCLADVDFCSRIAQRGTVGRARSLFGVKIAAQPQRENGRATGFAQVANAAHLARKGSFSRRLAFKLSTKFVASNAFRSLFSQPHIDSSGRLLGNLQAVVELLRRPGHAHGDLQTVRSRKISL